MAEAATPRVSVVVASFNRPRCLRECLLSLRAARPDEVIVADDGSEFDVAAVVLGALDGETPYFVATNPPIPPRERMTARRQGALLNACFAESRGDVLTLVCDDDLIHPGWFDTLRRVWADEPARPIARGEWLVFNDGETPTEDDPPLQLDARGMTAGNFAWHASFTRGHGARWPEDRTSCLDDGFLAHLWRAGCPVFGVPVVGRAGWRREHHYAGIHHSDGARHRDSLLPLLEAGFLEAERPS
jgi:glycosyltransferase involved in cell wall biosynthesis